MLSSAGQDVREPVRCRQLSRPGSRRVVGIDTTIGPWRGVALASSVRRKVPQLVEEPRGRRTRSGVEHDEGFGCTPFASPRRHVSVLVDDDQVVTPCHAELLADVARMLQTALGSRWTASAHKQHAFDTAHSTIPQPLLTCPAEAVGVTLEGAVPSLSRGPSPTA